MRFLSALLIAACLLGSVAWCQHLLTRNITFDVTREAHGHGEQVEKTAENTYTLELLPAFAAVRDPFALQTASTQEADRLLVRQADRVILRRTADLARGEAVTIPELAFEGTRVSLFVQATPSVEDARHPCALRIRVFQSDGALCDEQTLWSEGGGARVAGNVSCSLEPRRETLDRGLGGEPE